MRWFAFVFLLLNIGIWYLAQERPVSTFNSADTDTGNGGTLPRVESLKSPDGEALRDESEPEPEEVEVVSSEPAPVEIGDPVAPSIPRACVRIGWIESESQANALIEAHRGESAMSFAVEEVVQDKPPLNWVIIPPQPREAALRQFRDIQRQGIDSYLVTRGENRNAISLGLFESRAAAISVLEEKKRQNLNAVLVKFTRNQVSYALTFEARPESAKAMVGALEADHGKKFDFVEINPCEGVATPKKNP